MEIKLFSGDLENDNKTTTKQKFSLNGNKERKKKTGKKAANKMHARMINDF